MAHDVVGTPGAPCTPAPPGAGRSLMVTRLLTAALVALALGGGTQAFARQRAAPAPPARAVQETDAALAKALAERAQVTANYQAGAASGEDILKADLMVAEARFRQAVARGKDTDAVAALEAVVPLRERQLERVLADQKSGVAGPVQVNTARVALAQARVRLGLFTLVTLRQEEVQQTRAGVDAGILSRLDLDAAEKELDAARKRWADADGTKSR